MPQKGISRKTDRPCLICCGQTRVAHLGIDVCRACSVFYRRAEKGNTYTCRTSTKRCPLGPELTCKRCRFDHIDRLLKQSGAASHAAPSNNDQQIRASVSPQTPSSSSSNTGFVTVSTTTSRTQLTILERLKIQYRAMCRERLNSELHAMPNPPHPLSINVDTGPFFPATCVTLTLSNRILLTALLEFESSVFPELGTLENKDKWDITVNFFYRFRLFEGIYRARVAFPENLNKAFGGFTTWFDTMKMDNFYNDAPTGDRAAAQEYVKHMKHSGIKLQEVKGARELIQRVNPCHEEFLVVIALMFWTFGDMPVREDIALLGERYRQAILKELHAFYREQLLLDEYAPRLGELMMLLPAFDKTHEMKEHFEMLHLLDILPGDNFTYQLQRDD